MFSQATISSWISSIASIDHIMSGVKSDKPFLDGLELPCGGVCSRRRLKPIEEAAAFTGLIIEPFGPDPGGAEGAAKVPCPDPLPLS